MKFVVDKNIPLVEKAFGSLGEVVALETGACTSESVRDADVLIIRSETKVNRSLLDGSRVRFVGTATIGTDHIDLDYLTSKGIVFSNAPGSNSNSVKEYIVAALLNLSVAKGFSLKGKTIGVVGVGNVGSKVVKASEILDMTVLQNDPPLARQTNEKRFVSLDDLMDCDVLTVHVPLTKTGRDPTYRMFDSERFRKMRPGILFINTSRGAVLDSSALKEAIRQNRIHQTVIDVWENEPNIDPELLSVVTLGTSHIAGYSLEGKVNAVRMLREVSCRHFGITSSWDPTKELGIPDITNIIVPRDVLRMEEILHRVVSRCYNISFDDRLLRHLLSVPDNKRADYFINLRSGYRIRREFSNVTVQLPKERETLQASFIGLGFKVNISN